MVSVTFEFFVEFVFWIGGELFLFVFIFGVFFEQVGCGEGCFEFFG